MSEIIPAILPDSHAELSEKIGSMVGVAKTIHLDVCDGAFVPRVSWPYHPENSVQLTQLLSEEEGLPHWDKFDFEAHLMVARPEVLAEKWVRIGAMRIVAHAEAIRDFSALKRAVGELVELGIALKFETPIDAFAQFADDASLLHLMSISRLGYQGEKFQEGVIEKVREARKRFPNISIGVDGGVGIDNAKVLLDAGADRLVVGSALFENDDPRAAYRSLADLL